eukprot:351656-Chlamydomonas_euryale.AAC.3
MNCVHTACLRARGRAAAPSGCPAPAPGFVQLSGTAWSCGPAGVWRQADRQEGRAWRSWADGPTDRQAERTGQEVLGRQARRRSKADREIDRQAGRAWRSWADGLTDRQAEGPGQRSWADRQAGGPGQTDRQTSRQSVGVLGRWTDGQADRRYWAGSPGQTDKQEHLGRQTDRQVGRVWRS